MKRAREPGEGTDCGFDMEGAEPFAGGDSDLPTAKSLWMDVSDVEDQVNDGITMTCSMPPHKQPLAFKSYQEYESHYTMFHTNRCLECHNNFPSEHLLIVHIEECHDPLVRVKRDKGEHTYSCFVEGCERKCRTHHKRRLHMIDKHMYPRNFFFGVTKDGIDGRRSLLVEGTHHRRRSSTASVSKDARRRGRILVGRGSASAGKDDGSDQKLSKPNVEKTQTNQNVDAEMADLAGTMSALHFVPTSVRFGRGRAGFSKVMQDNQSHSD